MMKMSVILGILVMGLVGCVAEKSIPQPTTEMAASSGFEFQKLKRGHEVYLTQCSRCHEPVMPERVSDEDWHLVVPGMAWNAGISGADQDALMKYLMAAK